MDNLPPALTVGSQQPPRISPKPGSARACIPECLLSQGHWVSAEGSAQYMTRPLSTSEYHRLGPWILLASGQSFQPMKMLSVNLLCGLVYMVYVCLHGIFFFVVVVF